jgi:putative ABC transport system permease protein
VITASIAGIVGVAIAWGCVRAFEREVADAGLPYWTRFSFDAPLTMAIALICVGAGVVFGTLPAWHQSRANLNEVLNQGGRSRVASPRASRITRTLLIGELGLTVTLLAAAGALVRSANVVYRADQVVDVANIWEFRVALPLEKYATVDARRAFYAALEDRLAAAPGMQSAAVASAAPFNARDTRGVAMGQDTIESAALPAARLVAIGPRYFETLGLQVVRGTRLEDVDSAVRTSAALVNEQFVHRFSPDADPLGREVRLVDERARERRGERYVIVGIAPPLRQEAQSGHSPVVYVPHATQPGNVASILIRGVPEQFAEVLRQEVRRMDPDLPLFNLQSLEHVSYMSRWIQRIMSTAFSIVAVIAIVLSALGLYALTAYAASHRTQEVGVRIALGARRAQISWLFLRDALRSTAIGLAIGLLGAVAVGSVLQSALVDVRANHPLALAAVCLFVVAVAVTAALLPARRAARLDPIVALRHD